MTDPMNRPRLLVVIASTRPGRVGGPVGEWFVRHAEAQGAFVVEAADLAKIDLPMMDEPNHPRLGQYTQEHTKRWSATVAAADAFVFVMPEYNHGFTAPLKNAIDFLFKEWQDKPAGFVSYGGIAGGTRAVQLLKPVLVVLKIVPVSDAVPIPFVGKQLHDGHFTPSEETVTAATTMLNELARLAPVLKQLRDAS